MSFLPIPRRPFCFSFPHAWASLRYPVQSFILIWWLFSPASPGLCCTRPDVHARSRGLDFTSHLLESLPLALHSPPASEKLGKSCLCDFPAAEHMLFSFELFTCILRSPVPGVTNLKEQRKGFTVGSALKKRLSKRQGSSLHNILSVTQAFAHSGRTTYLSLGCLHLCALFYTTHSMSQRVFGPKAFFSHSPSSWDIRPSSQRLGRLTPSPYMCVTFLGL